MNSFTLGPHEVIEHEQWATRSLTLVCGPPGAGKTTYGLRLHRATLDIGELPPGTPRERMRKFGLLAYKAGRRYDPNLAVVRGAPLAADRAHLESLTRPCRTVILLTDADTCHERITLRDRPGVDGRDLEGQHDAADVWWALWDNDAAARATG